MFGKPSGNAKWKFFGGFDRFVGSSTSASTLNTFVKIADRMGWSDAAVRAPGGFIYAYGIDGDDELY
ncbi:hypothetical protein PENSUB_4098 [Penicillium subrubescens]|uniref:Uncharacterized protein n=1 Tax=Penicillium subrubescens TaxID=1316194 RepID=A0A1Q5UDA0_9EURO|nr:hypothetical protein PENSUB_4098 [Penicillium subrubescens]